MKNVYLFIVLFIALGSQFGAFAYDYFFETYASTEDNKVELIGNVPGGQLGADIASGDFNGDGIEDMAIGAPFVSSEDREWNGEVYIVFGNDAFPDVVDFSKHPPNLVVKGYSSGDQLGTTLTSGDYNNDGIDDFAIGAFNAASFEERPGKVYIFHGNSTWSSQDLNFLLKRPDLTLSGDDSGDNFGLSLITQDVDNDEIDDLIVGSSSASSINVVDSGVVYIFRGSNSGISSLFDFVINGNQSEERFGSDLGVGDIDGDGNQDLIVGAYYSTVDNAKQAGKVYVYSDVKGDGPVINEPSYTISGVDSSEWFGFAVDADDINGDEIDDIAITSFPYKGDRSSSKVSVYYGGEEFDQLPDVIVEDSVNDSLIGARVLLEDLDEDGNSEIIIGAPGIGFSTTEDPGDVYILHSGEIHNKSRFSVENKEVTSIINGKNPDDWFGYSVNVLDFNNDGFEDLAVGSRYADSGRSVNDGHVFVFFGDGTPFGNEKQYFETEDDYLTRGEFVSIIVDRFELKYKNEDYINDCYDHRDFCLFNFVTMSSFDVQLEPNVVLYPDIPLDHKYYEDVTVGTMLGLINGYLNEENSPFHPTNSVSRIQALKTVLGAADAVPPKYRFELVDILGSLDQLYNQHTYFADVDANVSHMWWYPRYVNFATDHDIVDFSKYFRPDETITKSELDDMIVRTLNYINRNNEKVESPADSEIETSDFESEI